MKRVGRFYMPYPAVWNALHDEPELRKAFKGMEFDGATRISKMFATEGLDAVKEELRRLASMPSRERAA